MRKISLVALISFLLYSCVTKKALVTADKGSIDVKIDLINVKDDKVMVEIDPGSFTADEVAFYIPKTVPGTYSTDNYGKYIEDFKAFDYGGKEISVSKSDDNTWNITEGKKLDKISYWVNDTFDSEAEQESPVFSPAGTNILAGENFVLNLHGFVGYFKDLKEVAYNLEVSAPNDLIATTSLAMVSSSNTNPNSNIDRYSASRYFEVIDNPIFYAKLNTETFQINDISVTLSVYSPTGVYTAASLKDKMQKMMAAQKSFLGEINGTKQYSILLYLAKVDEPDAGGFGALEHHTSTLVVLPEIMGKEALEQAMVDVVSHEFFHTVTPLNVHSEEVQYFDFNAPKMSQHLWMYEGTTEYFANLFQIQQGLIDEADFFERIVGKIQNAKGFDDTMSFTEMSKNILMSPYKENYTNVYEKGALINLALDLELRTWSNGEKGVLWLMKELSNKYGKMTPFKDENLINEIVAMTYPELRNFFDNHVIGDSPIDYTSYFSKVGLKMASVEKPCQRFFLDQQIPFIDADPTDNNAVIIRDGITLNNFFNDLGAQGGDVIKSINGSEVTVQGIAPILQESFTWPADKEIIMVVKREGQELVLKGVAGTPSIKAEALRPNEEASDTQIKLRTAWLKG